MSGLRDVARAVRRAYRSLRFAVRYPSSVKIDPTSWVARRSVVRVTGGGTIEIGAHCEIHDYAMLLTYGGNIKIGDHCSINPFTIIYGHGDVTLGSGVRIAAHTVIIPANHNVSDDGRPLHESGVRAQGITIGDNVWIGAGCRILDGVLIGPNAVIGAGSVVTKSIPPQSTAVGAPARVIGQR